MMESKPTTLTWFRIMILMLAQTSMTTMMTPCLKITMTTSMERDVQEKWQQQLLMNTVELELPTMPASGEYGCWTAL